MPKSADFHPTYSEWRHGGWYVNTIRYPGGAIGCVSRNYPDGKWRVVCGGHETPYPTRDEAAAAELKIAEAAHVAAGGFAEMANRSHPEAPEFISGLNQWKAGRGAIVTGWHENHEDAEREYWRLWHLQKALRGMLDAFPLGDDLRRVSDKKSAAHDRAAAILATMEAANG